MFGAHLSTSVVWVPFVHVVSDAVCSSNDEPTLHSRDEPRLVDVLSFPDIAGFGLLVFEHRPRGFVTMARSEILRCHEAFAWLWRLGLSGLPGWVWAPPRLGGALPGPSQAAAVSLPCF